MLAPEGPPPAAAVQGTLLSYAARQEIRVSSLLIRLVCGVLFIALVLGIIAHPPANLTQGLGMLLPGAFLLNFALRGTGRSRVPRKRAPAPPSETPRP
jgi:hypothetical protein